MHKQTIWVDARMARQLKVIAARTGTSMLELANTALREYLDKVDSCFGDTPPPTHGIGSFADESM